MLQTYLCGSRKPQTYFVFTPITPDIKKNSKVFDRVTFTFHLILVQIGPTVTLCFYGRIKPKKKNIVSCRTQQTYQSKNSPPKKLPQAVKHRGGGVVLGRYDRGQIFNGFFYGFP